MAVSFVNVGAVGGSGTSAVTSASPGLPASIQTNDILIAEISLGRSAATTETITAPTGNAGGTWALIANTQVLAGLDTHSQAIQTQLYSLVYNGTSPNLTWTWTDANEAFMRITAWRGGDTVAIIDGNAATTSSNSSTTLASPTFTPTVSGDALYLNYACGSQAFTSISPAGTTQAYAEAGGVQTTEIGQYQLLGGTGTTTAYTETIDSGNSSHCVVCAGILIKAASSADNPRGQLPIAAIIGNQPWNAAPRLIHQHNVVWYGPTGPGFCGRAQAVSNAASTSVTISFPAGTTAGDFVLVAISSSSGMCAAPAGWTQVASTITNSASEAMGLFWKIYTVSDGASVTFGTTNLNFCEAIMRVYCGVMAIDANNSATSASAVTSLQIPALTATKFSNEIYVGFWSSDDNVVNGPNDLIDQTSNHFDGGVTATWATFDGDKVLPTAGSVPPAETSNLAAGQAAANWMGFAVTLILTDATPALRVPPPPRAGMIPWIAPIAAARTTTTSFQPIDWPNSRLPIQAVQQAWWAPVPALQATVTPFRGATENDARPAQLPLQAIQQQWWAPVTAARHTIAPFNAANPPEYTTYQLPSAAIQPAWQAPIPGAQRATTVPFSPANPIPYDQPMAPLQAVQAGMTQWTAPVVHAQATTTPFHGATENDARPSQLPLQAIQQAWQAPIPALHPTTVPFSPANPIPYDQQMAPLAAVQAGMRGWSAPVAQARTTTGDVTPPVATTGEPRLSQLPSAAIQQGWWAPVQALQPTTVPFSPANPPEYTTYKLPSAAIQQSWWAPVPALQPTDVLFNPANPIPYDQQMAPFAAVRSGMAGWWAPVPALQVRASWEGAVVEQRTAQLPIAAIQPSWWAPVPALQVTNTPFHGATEADARPSQLPLQTVQQAWWAPVPGLHPSMGVLFSPANPPEFTIYKLPSSAVQGGWWSPLWGIHVTSAEFKGPSPAVGVDAIVIWRERGGF